MPNIEPGDPVPGVARLRSFSARTTVALTVHMDSRQMKNDNFLALERTRSIRNKRRSKRNVCRKDKGLTVSGRVDL